MKKLLLAVMIVFFCPIASVWAVRVSSLYKADLPVVSQAEDVRTQAMRDGFLQVLNKVSGDLNVEKNPDIKASLKSATNYVQEYSYTPSPETPATPYQIHITYDTHYTNQLLKRSGLSYWGQSRPLILVWMAVTNADNVTEIVSDESHAKVLNAMRNQGQQYGVPLMFPVMDPSDLDKVSPDTIANMDLEQLQAAAKRYAPDAMLIGYIRETKQGLAGQWQLVMNENQWDFVTESPSVDKMVNSVLNQASQTLANKHVPHGGDAIPELWVTVQVSNLTEEGDFQQVVQYLKQLVPVEKVVVNTQTGTNADMDVLIRGTLQSFLQTAEEGRRLTLKSEDDDNSTLKYEWVH